jgi:hypothetical protein
LGSVSLDGTKPSDGGPGRLRIVSEPDSGVSGESLDLITDLASSFDEKLFCDNPVSEERRMSTIFSSTPATEGPFALRGIEVLFSVKIETPGATYIYAPCHMSRDIGPAIFLARLIISASCAIPGMRCAFQRLAAWCSRTVCRPAWTNLSRPVTTTCFSLPFAIMRILASYGKVCPNSEWANKLANACADGGGGQPWHHADAGNCGGC